MPPRNRGHQTEPSQLATSGKISDNVRVSTSWDPQQRLYLQELVWMAMLLLNREPSNAEFKKPIADAMHRRFQGTLGHILKGYNTLHSEIVKKPGWPDFKAFVLPFGSWHVLTI